jgi:protocatechuate 3,4-dioxygenase beta subunit
LVLYQAFFNARLKEKPKLKSLLPFIVIFSLFVSCKPLQVYGQTDRQVGGPCEGCEAIDAYLDQELKSIDTIPGFEMYTPKMHVSGIVYQNDGKTPAPNIYLYFYQTDTMGLYSATSEAVGWERRHGKHQLCLKADENGRYSLYSFRPASYPNGQEVQHIHITVKEKGLSPYYIDSIVFDDDPLMSSEYKSRLQNRGGSGITSPVLKDGIIEVRRDIILGLNIPDY